MYCYLVTSWSGEIPEKVLDKGSILEWIDRKTFVPKLKPVKQILRLANDYVVQCYCTSTPLSVK